MRITIDRVALKELIGNDPGFHLELKAAVISEVFRRFFEKDSKRIIAQAETHSLTFANNRDRSSVSQ